MLGWVSIGDDEHRYARLVPEHHGPFEAEEYDADAPMRRANLQYARDHDRLLYSGGFRTLGGITQVVTSGENTTFHNRLTHSLKVAQTARVIGENLGWRARHSGDLRDAIAQHGGLNLTVLETACLAHDIGHPPFGHIGESAIQTVLKAADRYIPGYRKPAREVVGGFEGNAQSFRIVTRLAFRDSITVDAGADETTRDSGLNAALNLTRASLRALSKYPWSNADERAREKKKWGAYASEAKILEWAMAGLSEREVEFHGRPLREARSIEAQIMDWSDDVAYAVHDVEDFFRAGLVPLDQLRWHEGVEFNNFLTYAMNRVEDKLPARSVCG